MNIPILLIYGLSNQIQEWLTPLTEIASNFKIYFKCFINL